MVPLTRAKSYLAYEGKAEIGQVPRSPAAFQLLSGTVNDLLTGASPRRSSYTPSCCQSGAHEEVSLGLSPVCHPPRLKQVQGNPEFASSFCYFVLLLFLLCDESFFQASIFLLVWDEKMLEDGGD